MRLHLQFSAFFLVGLATIAMHYGVLVALVQLLHVAPVPATLCGYVAGGFVSYTLNRAHVFETERNHVAALWRFVGVAAVGFVLTGIFMHIFVDRFGAPYIPAQLVTTGIVMFWSFFGHKFWTFGEKIGR
ncbi:MAG: GtrA family protein [Rhodoblastus sp.]